MRTVVWIGALLAAVIATGCGGGSPSRPDSGGPDGSEPDGGPGDGGNPEGCPAGTWDADGDPETDCIPWSVCAPGTYVMSEGSAEDDRTCSLCAAGTFSGVENAASCSPWRDCAAGEYVASAGDADSDRLCAPCSSGAFSAETNAGQCSEWSDCTPGQYVSAAGSASSDRACAACAAGTFSSQSNSSACMPIGECAAGTHQTAPGTSQSPAQCAMCEAGTYCAGGQAPPLPCATGTWDDDASAASACISWSSCAPGFRVSSSGSATADRSCTECADGFYSDATNAASCLPVGACEAGTYVVRAGTRTSPVVCDPCEVGTYCPGATTMPQACAAGTWDHDRSSATACVAWSDCVAGEYVVSAGTTRADRTCAACPDGGMTSGLNRASCEPGAWLLSYFGPEQDVRADSLHFAYSTDGLRWARLGHGEPVYRVSGIGTNHIRDPFLFRKNDGSFVYLATDWTRAENDANYWGRPSPNILVADSPDLIQFTNPRLLLLTDHPGPNGGPMHAWAPEAYYDRARDTYAIVWSGNDPTWRNRIYVNYTEDFREVDTVLPPVFFDPGYDVIDATIERWNGDSYLFFKDETGPGKDIQIARATGLSLEPGSFTRWSADYVTRGGNQSTSRGTEGPLAIYSHERGLWYMFADFYGNGGVFGAWSSPSLDAAPASWTELSSTQFRFPAGVRHAHALRITQSELDRLIAHYGVSHRLRTTYSEGGAPFYVAHSWYHGIITPEADRGRGQAADDFVWAVRPGLADPNDPDLVSFEAVGHPGRFLRADSANRYPPCDEPSNRGWGLCWVAEADRHHLTWVDAAADSAAFRSDATFRIVPALNGDASMVSLEWYSDSTRYLRHRAYQLFALPAQTAQDNVDSSFVIERE